MIPRHPDEWVTIAMVAPDLKIVFTEGATDAGLLCVAANHPDGADFRSADEIEWTDEPGSRWQFASGNRDKVIAVSRSLTRFNSETKGPQVKNIQLLVDRDFGDHVNDWPRPTELMITDHANIVSSVTDKSLLKDVFLSAYGYRIADEDWTQLISITRLAFLGRYYNRWAELGRNAPAVDKFLSISSGELQFNANKYIMDFFGVDTASATLKKTEIETFSVSGIDDRNHINSNDLYDFVYGLLRKKKRIAASVPRTTIRATIQAAIPTALRRLPVVGDLIRWAA